MASLFDNHTTAPLAERRRPRRLADYAGQTHLLGENGVLRRYLAAGRLPSLILWGPPGVGKTTLALLLAEELKRPFFMLSAINAGVKDVRDVIDRAKKQTCTVLFIDEIHRLARHSKTRCWVRSKTARSRSSAPPPKTPRLR